MRLTFLVVLAILSISTYSQLQLHLIGGANLNFLDVQTNTNNYADASFSRIGFHAGVLGEWNITQKWNFQTGLFFKQKGSNIDPGRLFKYEGYDISGEIFMRYNYLEIPVQMAWKVHDFKLFGGPYIALGLGGEFYENIRYMLRGTFFEIVEKDLRDIKPAFNPGDANRDEIEIEAFDFGLNIGLQWQWKRVLILAQYSRGLMPFHLDTSSQQGRSEAFHNNVSLSLGYRIFPESNIKELSK